MDYIVILIMCIFASAKLCFRNIFDKKNSKNSIDIWYFNVFAFMMPALVLLPKVFVTRPIVLAYAAIAAVLMVLCYFFYTKALSFNSDAPATAVVVNFALVINVVTSFFFFHEPISNIRLVGIALAVVAFIICGGIPKKSANKKWLTFSILAMLTYSAMAIVQKLFGASPYSEENFAFVSFLYAVASATSAVIYFFLRRKEKVSYKMDLSALSFILGVGLCLGVFQAIYMFIMSRLDGTFFFPVQTATTTILSVIAGILVFKEKFSKRQLLGAVLSFVSLILISY